VQQEAAGARHRAELQPLEDAARRTWRITASRPGARRQVVQHLRPPHHHLERAIVEQQRTFDLMDDAM
jgi:hypothetical protein